MKRSSPVRHKVKPHTRKGKTVKSHIRGTGTKKKTSNSRSRTIRCMPEHLDTANSEYVFGDFDMDGTPNIDDEEPFDPTNDAQVEEILLTDELRKLEESRGPLMITTKMLANKLGRLGHRVMFRVKTRNSTINKLRRKQLQNVLDRGGAMVITDDRNQARKVDAYIRKNFNILERKDYFKNPKPDGYAHAFHYYVMFRGKTHEIQVKSKKDYQVHIDMHTAYKNRAQGNG